jgi:hypothetical protein
VVPQANTQATAPVTKDAPAKLEAFGEFLFELLGEAITEPRVVLAGVLLLGALAIILLAVAVVAEMFSGSGPPQSLGLK